MSCSLIVPGQLGWVVKPVNGPAPTVTFYQRNDTHEGFKALIMSAPRTVIYETGKSFTPIVTAGTATRTCSLDINEVITSIVCPTPSATPSYKGMVTISFANVHPQVQSPLPTSFYEFQQNLLPVGSAVGRKAIDTAKPQRLCHRYKRNHYREMDIGTCLSGYEFTCGRLQFNEFGDAQATLHPKKHLTRRECMDICDAYPDCRAVSIIPDNYTSTLGSCYIHERYPNPESHYDVITADLHDAWFAACLHGKRLESCHCTPRGWGEADRLSFAQPDRHNVTRDTSEPCWMGRLNEPERIGVLAEYDSGERDDGTLNDGGRGIDPDIEGI